jgi:hypothetical protein
LPVSEKYKWAQDFSDLQSNINGEIRNIFSSGGVKVLKELEVVETAAKKLYPMIQEGVDLVEVAEAFQNSVSDLGRGTENFCKD